MAKKEKKLEVKEKTTKKKKQKKMEFGLKLFYSLKE